MRMRYYMSYSFDAWPPVGVLSLLSRNEPGDLDILGPGGPRDHP